MRKFIGFTKRNILIYFKDIHAVIFSLLTSIIVFVLYLLFLKGNYVSSLEEAMTGLEGLVDAEDVDRFVNGLLLCGILGSAMITVPFNCLSTIVRDREKRVDYDILATPIRRGQIILSYFTASAFSAFLMSTVILAVGLGILSAQGGLYLDAAGVLALLGVNVVGSLSATALFMVVVIFFKSTSASGAFFGILAAASGFIIGAYIPLSEFSQGIRTFCNCFPGTGITILYRNLLLDNVLEHINDGIGGLDNGAFVEALKEVFVFEPQLFGSAVSQAALLVYIAAFSAVCMVLLVALYGKVYKKR